MKQKIVIASSNQHKIQEISQILDLNENEYEVISQTNFNVPECPEPFLTFIENSLAKARHTSKYTNLPAIADDSGICIPALSGMPAVHSARWAEFNDYAPEITDKDKRNNLYLCHKIEELYKQNLSIEHINKPKITAYYYCTIVMVKNELDPAPIISTARLYGEIQLIPKGNNGFGYDPHFYLPQLNKTAAELTAQEKNQISHRRLAINKFLHEFKEMIN